ncbi:MAG TPA: response regulator transcription factor [Actinomycetota bacterium]|nr:response regulator transcription factor [Actinomycetota bacterium]
MAGDRVRVVIADDVEALRKLLRRVLERDGRFEIVGEASDGAVALELAICTLPDLVVLDLMMPVMGGVEAIPRIRASSPDSRILVISGLEDQKGDAWGADAALSKGASIEEIITTIGALVFDG